MTPILRWSAISVLTLLVSAAPPQAPPALLISDVTVGEPNTGHVHASFRVSLVNAKSHGTVTVDYSTLARTANEGVSCLGAGEDYLGAHTGSLRIDATESSDTILIVVCGDTRHERTETFLVHLFNEAGAVIQDREALGTIIDNDPAPASWAGLDVSGAVTRSQEQRWETPPLPAGNYAFDLTGTGGDADLYVRTHDPPTTTNYSCRPAKSGSNESCLVSVAESTVIHVMVRGYASSSTTFHLIGRAR